MKGIQEEKLEASKRLCIPSEANTLNNRQHKIIDNFKEMDTFIEAFLLNLERRVLLINKDIVEKRRADKMNQVMIGYYRHN